MFITPAYAQETQNIMEKIMSGGGEHPITTFTSLTPLILIMIVFYFLVIRPQNKKVREHKIMVSNLKKNDQVITAGGIVGKVKKLNNDKEVTVEIADGVNATILRNSIMVVRDTITSTAK